jgi:hypothetical protein
VSGIFDAALRRWICAMSSSRGTALETNGSGSGAKR